MKETIIVNLVAGPGAGKSTLASGLFHQLKIHDIDSEIVTEFAKDKTWEKNFIALDHQFYISANQKYRQDVLNGQVDVIITDSPILLGLLYYQEKDPVIKNHFEQFIIETYKKQNNLTVFIERKKKYNKNGRNQTEEEAKVIDQHILALLSNNNIPFIKVEGDKEGKGLRKLYKELEKRLKKTAKIP